MTGDVTVDWRFGQSQMIDRRGQMFDPEYYLELYGEAAGAALLGEIIKKTIQIGMTAHSVIAPDSKAALDRNKTEPYWHSYSVCCQYPPSERPGDEDGDPVWRVARKLGIDRIDPDTQRDTLLAPADTGDADLVVVDEAQQWFARQSDWPPSLCDPHGDAWLLLKWSRPEFYKHNTLALWLHGIAKFPGRVAAIVTAEDLRLMGMRISRSLSWERTIEDLDREIRELWFDAAAVAKERPPHGCTYLIVSFMHAGAVLYSMHDGTLDARFVYDPMYIEGDWQRAYKGSMVGFTRCLTAGVAVGMLEAQPFGTIDAKAIGAGIIAARRLLSGGFEASDDPTTRNDTALPLALKFPTDSTARVLRRLLDHGNAVAAPEQIDKKLVDADRAVDEMASAFHQWAIPRDLQKRTWKIVDDHLCGGQAASSNPPPPVAPTAPAKELSVRDRRILKEARQIVEYGSDKMPRAYPVARFGKVVVTDRSEIESLRAIRGLMQNYLESESATAPLSIAVFGPPGAGKSTTITELAQELSTDQKRSVRTLVFNLSQFSAPHEISDALQQVRDVGLAGEMPLVFWDEFDTDLQKQSLGWLRYFLAPMQDGRFQEGPITHKIGRAIFVFAGGTSTDMNAFLAAGGMVERTNDDETESGSIANAADGDSAPPMPDSEEQTEIKKRIADGIAAKVPDFVSRLKGFVNIPRLNYTGAMLDSAIALRRAELLRAFLLKAAEDLVQFVPGHGAAESAADEPVGSQLFPPAITVTAGDKVKLRRRLNVDRGVINAFIRIREYKHSARSMEAIVKMSALSGKRMFDRASLPPLEQLNLHVAAKRFLAIVDESWAERESGTTPT